jgi:hypothetical protein
MPTSRRRPLLPYEPEPIRVAVKVVLGERERLFAVTGYAPFFFFEGRLRLSGLVGLLLSAALIRWFGLAGTQPADFVGEVSGRLLADSRRRRRLLFTLAVCWAAASVWASPMASPTRSESAAARPMGSG